jgi:hypothetical protein
MRTVRRYMLDSFASFYRKRNIASADFSFNPHPTISKSHFRESYDPFEYKMIITYDFDDATFADKEGRQQMKKRRSKGKKEWVGVEVNDRSLVKKLQAREDCTRLELNRVHCHVALDVSLFGVQATYRSHLSNGSCVETQGKIHYFSQGKFSFKTDGTEDVPAQRVELTFERKGSTIHVQDQDGKQTTVSPSQKIGLLRKCRTQSVPSFRPKKNSYLGNHLMLQSSDAYLQRSKSLKF